MGRGQGHVLSGLAIMFDSDDCGVLSPFLLLSINGPPNSETGFEATAA